MREPLPEGDDPEILRAWLRERRSAPYQAPSGQPDALTHDLFLQRQFSRLLASAGLSVDDGAMFSGSAIQHAADDAERPRIDLALSGGVVVGHEAPIALLGAFFTHLQNAISAVAQTLTGSPTAASLVPGHIRAATLLRSVATFDSSYGVRLVGPTAPEESQQQLPGFPPLGYRADGRLLEDSVTTICDIIDATHGSDDSEADDRLTGQVVSLGQRAMRHLGELSATLSEGDVGVSLVWQPDRAESRRCLLEPAGARRLKRISDVVEFEESAPRRVEGLLSAVDLRRRTVEILLDSGTPINARVIEELTPRLMEGVLGKRVVADAGVSIVRYATGRQRELYILTTLDPAADG